MCESAPPPPWYAPPASHNRSDRVPEEIGARWPYALGCRPSPTFQARLLAGAQAFPDVNNQIDAPGRSSGRRELRDGPLHGNHRPDVLRAETVSRVDVRRFWPGTRNWSSSSLVIHGNAAIRLSVTSGIEAINGRG